MTSRPSFFTINTATVESVSHALRGTGGGVERIERSAVQCSAVQYSSSSREGEVNLSEPGFSRLVLCRLAGRFQILVDRVGGWCLIAWSYLDRETRRL